MLGMDQTTHFRVDRLLRRLRKRLLATQRVAQELLLLRLGVGDRAELVGKAQLRHHRPRHPRALLYVRRRARRHIVVTEHQLLGYAAAHGDGEHRDHKRQQPEFPVGGEKLPGFGSKQESVPHNQ